MSGARPPAGSLLLPRLATDDAFLSDLNAECWVLSGLYYPSVVGFREQTLSDVNPPAMVLELVPLGSPKPFDRLSHGLTTAASTSLRHPACIRRRGIGRSAATLAMEVRSAVAVQSHQETTSIP